MVSSNLALQLEVTTQPKIEVQESPVKWCSVSLSDVVSRGKRLEASVFDVEAKQAREKISKGILTSWHWGQTKKDTRRIAWSKKLFEL